MDNPFQSPIILSFCPGLLGLERGLERAIGPIQIAAYVEIEAFICANLVAGMESGILAPAPIWTDIKTFPAKFFRKKIHGIIGGYPCQPFSTAGKRKGTEDDRHLWPYIYEHVKTIKPSWCWFENVAGHLGLGYDYVYKSLQSLGYAIEAGLFTASEAGAPHKRQRLFILAIANRELQYWCRKKNDSWPKQCSGLRDKQKQAMANPTSFGTQGLRGKGKQITNIPIEQKIFGCDSERNVWPARRGEKQYEWEESRTIESGMGCTAHGYNFREDLLRALGNSVVEQTAEIAFLDLLRKHFYKKE